MFGPDVCGTTRRVHLIFNYKGKNHLIKNEIPLAPFDDVYTHVYTLIVKPDHSFQVLIDNQEQRKGNLLDDFDFLPPKEIPDPKVSKPSDWVDKKDIPDPSATKPEGWDKTPKKIKDPEASRPEDWDSELDGEWEAPLIDNPDYKGEWKAPLIPNPDYKGEWVHPKIPNPAFQEDKTIGMYDSNKYIGIEVWQVKSGTIFDNFLVTDDVNIAKEWAEKSIKLQQKEKELHEANKEEEPEEEENPHGFNPHGDMFGGGGNPHGHMFGGGEDMEDMPEDDDGGPEESFHAHHGHHHDEL